MSNKNKQYQTQKTNIEEAQVMEQTAPLTDVEEPTEQMPQKGKVVNCEKLNIRNKAQGEVLTVVSKGEELMVLPNEVLGMNLDHLVDKWLKVELSDGTVGYCMSDYIKLLD